MSRPSPSQGHADHGGMERRSRWLAESGGGGCCKQPTAGSGEGGKYHRIRLFYGNSLRILPWGFITMKKPTKRGKYVLFQPPKSWHILGDRLDIPLERPL